MSEQQTHEQESNEQQTAGHESREQQPPGRDPLEEARARIAELEDNWRRTAAELDNFRKRCAKDLVRARQQERARTAAGWLPVLDNLERALEHASSDPEHIVEGVRAVYQQAMSVLSSLGFPRRDDTGKAFDPALHEAVGTVADEQLVPGTVAHVVRAGYGSDDEILRPAAVVVATRSD
jgi:molecular chaperone GrpE